MRFLRPTPARLLPALALWALLAALPARAQVTGISYTLSPTIEHVFWNDNAGLDGGTLYGGQLGLGFGEYVELSGLYLFSDAAQTSFGDFSGLSDDFRDALDALPQRDVKIRRYGAEMKLNLLQRAVIPFVTAGTGILRFDPDEIPSSSRIYLQGGVGVQFSAANRYTFTIQAENLSYRYNAGATLFSADDLEAAGLSGDSFNQADIHNWALKASLSLYLGGRRRGEMSELDRALRDQFSEGLRGISLQVEPFAGEVNFADGLGYQPSQRVAGLYTGIDVGAYLGLRGFYWRGLQEDTFADMADIQSFGGELRLRLNSGYQSLEPFVALGGGYVDVLEGYQSQGELAQDQPYAAAGFGLVLPIGNALKLRGSVRGLLISDEATDDISQPSDVQTSYLYSAGVSFVLGGSRDDGAGSVMERGFEDTRAAQLDLAQRLDSATARLDSLSRVLDAVRTERLAAVPDSLRPAERPVARMRADDGTTGIQQFVTLPIPERGELYIRFGEPGGVELDPYAQQGYYADDAYYYDPQALAGGDTLAAVPPARAAVPPPAGTLTAEQVRQIVRDTIREQLDATDTASDAELQRIEQRLEQQLSNIETRLQARLDAEAAVAPEPVVVDVEGDRVGSDDRTILGGFLGLIGGILTLQGQEFSALLPLTGVQLGTDAPEQFILGVRGDFRPSFDSAVRFYPDFMFGFGQGETSFLTDLNAVFVYDASVVQPYFGPGFGIHGYDAFNNLDLAFNLVFGAERAFGDSSFFAEYNMADFGQSNRILAGYRVRF